MPEGRKEGGLCQSFYLRRKKRKRPGKRKKDVWEIQCFYQELKKSVTVPQSEEGKKEKGSPKGGGRRRVVISAQPLSK